MRGKEYLLNPRLESHRYLPHLKFLDYRDREHTTNLLKLTEIARLHYYLGNIQEYQHLYNEFSARGGSGKWPKLPATIIQNIRTGTSTTTREIFEEAQNEVGQNYGDYQFISGLYKSAWNKLKRQGLSSAISEVVGSIVPRPHRMLIPTSFGMGASDWDVWSPPEYKQFGLDSLFGDSGLLYVRRDINRPKSDKIENQSAANRRVKTLLHELVAHASTGIDRLGTSIADAITAYHHPYKEMLMEYITRELQRRLGYPVTPIDIQDTAEFTVLNAFYQSDDYNGPKPELKHPGNIGGVIYEILKDLEGITPS